MSQPWIQPPHNRRTQELINDAAVQIYNLGIATTDQPAHVRFGLIANVVGQAIEDAIRHQRKRLLENSNN
jgi:hypothetical protein